MFSIVLCCYLSDIALVTPKQESHVFFFNLCLFSITLTFSLLKQHYENAVPFNVHPSEQSSKQILHPPIHPIIYKKSLKQILHPPIHPSIIAILKTDITPNHPSIHHSNPQNRYYTHPSIHPLQSLSSHRTHPSIHPLQYVKKNIIFMKLLSEPIITRLKHPPSTQPSYIHFT